MCKNLENKANLFTIIAGICAVIAVVASGFTYYNSVIMQEKIAAYTFWQNYLNLAVNNPKYANGKYDKDNEKDRYEWFVTNALAASEIIYEFRKNDEGWKETIKRNIKVHKAYIKENKSIIEDYGSEFQLLILEILNTP